MKLLTQVYDRLKPFWESSLLTREDLLAWEYLQPVVDFQQILVRPDWHVVFFGAFKTGKSTVINAICGTQVLPTRNNRATGVVTKIAYAPQERVTVTKRSPQGKLTQGSVPYISRADYILLDVSTGIAQAPQDIEEITIGLKHPLLRARYTLVDTPGIMDNAVLTRRSLQELERSDLVVMVLSATQILSLHEKEIIQHIHEQLQSNLFFAVNRMDEVEEEEREETIHWVRTYLKGLGITNMYIYATQARKTFQKNGRRNLDKGLQALIQRLFLLRERPDGEVMVARARLGILSFYLTEAQNYCQAQYHEVEKKYQEYLEQKRRKMADLQTQWRKQIQSKRQQLHQCRHELLEYRSKFVEKYVSEVRQLMERDPKWRNEQNLSACFAPAIKLYTQLVTSRIEQILAPLNISLPSFSLAEVQGNNLDLPADVAGIVGGIVGGMIGAMAIFIGPFSAIAGTTLGVAAGRWIGKSVFKVDAQQEILKAVETGAQNLMPTLLKETERYIEQIEKVLIDFTETNMLRLQELNGEAHYQEKKEAYRAILVWISDFQGAITEIRSAFL